MGNPEIEIALNQIQNKNYSAALRVLAPLVEAGNPEAICNLATLYQNGLGVKVDGLKAVELYLQVAEQNIRENCLSGIAYNNLATIYGMGIPGVKRDSERAQKYERLAKDLGFPM